MNITPIRTEEDHQQALQRIEVLFDAEPGTIEGDELDILATLVEAYEAKQFPINEPDPIEAIKFRMEQEGYTDADLVQFIGQRGRVSEVLNKKRGLTLAMIRKLYKGLGIPLETLINDYQLSN